MAVEIERRFLVCSPAWKDLARRGEHLQQGYLVHEPVSLRVRVGEEGRAWLTLKARLAREGMAAAPGRALARQEFEYAVPSDDAMTMLTLSSSRVEKIRSLIEWPGGGWAVDEFLGANAPLCLCEVELEDPEACVHLPEWCGLEVTHRHDLSNAALARHPLAMWTEKDRAAVTTHLGLSRS